MKKSEKIDLIKYCIISKKILRAYFKYDDNYFYYYPNAVSDKFVLGQAEEDFELNGYHIRKISHMTKAEIKDDLCEKINLWNGVAAQIKDPGVDITSWQTIFSSPVLQNRFIIIEDEIDGEFALGSIRKICGSHLLFDAVDADGITEDEPWKIPYSEITHVCWSDRYSENFYNFLHQKTDEN